MTPPVVAIGLDAAEPTLVERWIEEGHLPVMARLRQDGTYARLASFDYCRAEAACTSFLTGCSSLRTGRWEAFKLHADYSIEELQAYEFDEYPPFYALGAGRRVAMFDLPQTRISDRVDGLQVTGWGAHSPMTPRASVPESLLPEIIARYGEHPTYERDHCAVWDAEAMTRLRAGLELGIARRAAICRDLLARETWDLFITYFGETHSAGHFFWHTSQKEHPLYPGVGAGDALLAIYRAVDTAIGEILAAAPAGARVVLFSDHGMEPNGSDLPSLVFLPELLYRWSSPGRVGIEAPSDREAPPPPVQPRASRSWTDEVWARKHDANPVTRALRRRVPVDFFHYAIEKRLGINGVPLCPEDCRLGHQPPMWYSPEWPRMRAFALPSFSEGYVRINLQGREQSGVVRPSEYDRVRDEVAELVGAMRDARSGLPLVSRIVKPRLSADDRDPRLPDADLLVLWAPRPVDVVDTPFGRIGPIPFQRTGSHVERGFLLAAGPGIPRVSEGRANSLDLAPTILSLIGAEIPPHMEGRALPLAVEPA